MAQRIAQGVKLAVVTNLRAGVKRFKFQSSVVHGLLGFLVGGQQHLEPTVHTITVHHVRSNAPAHAIALLQHKTFNAMLLQPDRAGETSQPGSDNDYWFFRHLALSVGAGTPYPGSISL